ncbi:MAG: ankyrin repeat domain-containing protein [Phycisphaerales bacterium]|nr:ankyrin repeat domain-containing protein [Phycisphaerales bacterium]
MFMFLLDISVKATIVLAGAGLASLLLRRYSAAARHLLWTGSIIALLLLPLASLALPAWNVLPYWVAPQRLATIPSASAFRIEPQFPVVAAAVESPVIGVDRVGGGDGTLKRELQVISPDRVCAGWEWKEWREWGGWLPWLYLFGAFVVLTPLVFAPIYLRRLMRSAATLAGGGWEGLLSEVRQELGVRRLVRLLRGSTCSMPVTFGVLRPVILLPATAESWGEDRRRTVLLHELSHVKRWDTLVQLLSQIACAVYWFHPLAWYAASRLSVERERACDDLVLRSGTEPSAYASELLSIAESHHAVRGGGGGLAMARPSTLEGRLKAVLDPSRNRRGITRMAFLACTVSLCVLAMVLAICHAADGPSPALTPEAWVQEKGGDKISEVNAKIGDRGETLMHMAAAEGRMDVLVWLKARGADVNAKDDFDNTPIWFAASKGHFDVMKWFKEQGADVNAKNRGGLTLMHAAARGGNFDAMKWAKEQGMSLHNKGNLGQTLMLSAASGGNVEAMKWLKEQGLDVNTKDQFDETPMYVAAKGGHVEAMKWLKEQGQDVNAKDKKGVTPMHCAAREGHLDAMKWLKEQGADVNAKTESGRTVMSATAVSGKIEAMKWLMEQGVPIQGDDTLMRSAACKGDVEFMKWLKAQGVSVNVQDKSGTPMHSAALNGHIEAMKWLKEQGVGVDDKNGYGETPMYSASLYSRLDAMKWLKEQGADVNAKTERGYTLMHASAEAFSGDRVSVMKWLKEQGVDVNAQAQVGTTPMLDAAWYGRLDVMKWLKEQGADIHAADTLGRTPMHRAAERGCLDIMIWLKEQGADANVSINGGATPMHSAATFGRLDVMKWLKEQGADVNARDRMMNWTPMHQAAGGYGDQVAVMAWLKEQGAEMSPLDKLGKTPLDRARTDEAKKWLRDNGAQ